MIGLLQRVTQAEAGVDGVSVGKIGPGLLVLICAERGYHLRRLFDRGCNTFDFGGGIMDDRSAAR